MKKFFQNTWVAVTITILCIVSAILIGQAKKNADASTVHDEIGMFTEEQTARLEIYNSAWKSDYGCSIYVWTVKSTGSKTLEKYAEKLCSKYDLDDADALLLISKKASSWYFANAESGEKLDSVITGRVKTYLTEILDSGYSEDKLDPSAVLSFFAGADNVLAGRISEETLAAEEEPVVEDRYSASDWTDYINEWLKGGTNEVLFQISEGTGLIHSITKGTGKLIGKIIKIITGSSIIFAAGLVIVIIMIVKKVRRRNAAGNSIGSANSGAAPSGNGARNANPYSNTARQSSRSGYSTDQSLSGQSHTVYNGGRHNPGAPGTRGGQGGAGGQGGVPGRDGN